MKIYYTASDIEELAAKGVKRLDIGPNVSLTDFARETAEQLDVELVLTDSETDLSSSPPPLSGRTSPAVFSGKPKGCQHGPLPPQGTRSVQSTNQAASNQQADSSGTVNRLVDLMGKIMNRGD
jgi:hypothetical protein